MKILTIIVILFCSTLAFSQSGAPSAPAIDAATRQAVINGAIRHLNDSYVFPEKAKQMEAAVRERMQRGEYDRITNARQLADTLTQHFQEVSHDKHLRVRYSAEPLPVNNPEQKPDAEAQARQRAFMGARNFGFEKVERLNGNIGYLELRGFVDAELAGETAAAAMSFLHNTDALIIDLRRNGGGQPEMVALLSSYLFDKPVHLNDIYWRPNNSTREFWTKETVPGKKYGNKNVYLLTSKFTFSGAEEFSYNLKNLKRATLIGETTGGGAHPVMFQRINDHFGIGVPAGRAINPITKTNWEGTGVSPDVEVPAAQALQTAHLMALKDVLAKTKDTQRAEELKTALAMVEREAGAASRSSDQNATQTTSSSDTDVALPDTPAGKTVGAFVKALNTGDPATLRRFHEERGGSPENAEQDVKFYNMSGGLKLRGVRRSEPLEIEVLAEMNKDSRQIRLTLSVAADAPHGITGIRMQPATDKP